jgi:hypothetical protein
MPSLVTILLSALLVSYALAVVMPTWRWLLAIALLVGVSAYTDRCGYWIESFLANADQGRSGAPGIVLVYVGNVGCATGVVVREFTLLPMSWGLRRRYVVMVCVAGSAIAPAIITFAPKLVAFSSYRFG